MGRDRADKGLTKSCRYFNPRARVGRDAIKSIRGIRECYFNPRARVGRDGLLDRLALVLGISIHAPAWGATRHNAFCRRLVSISIHAPAWGATGAPPPEARRALHFNPRARVGRDP